MFQFKPKLKFFRFLSVKDKLTSFQIEEHELCDLDELKLKYKYGFDKIQNYLSLKLSKSTIDNLFLYSKRNNWPNELRKNKKYLKECQIFIFIIHMIRKITRFFYLWKYRII